jgi:hypothetical protein
VPSLIRRLSSVVVCTCLSQILHSGGGVWMISSQWSQSDVLMQCWDYIVFVTGGLGWFRRSTVPRKPAPVSRPVQLSGDSDVRHALCHDVVPAPSVLLHTLANKAIDTLPDALGAMRCTLYVYTHLVALACHTWLSIPAVVQWRLRGPMKIHWTPCRKYHLGYRSYHVPC